nr:hypothetical protein [Zobellella taiwanensis]
MKPHIAITKKLGGVTGLTDGALDRVYVCNAFYGYSTCGEVHLNVRLRSGGGYCGSYNARTVTASHVIYLKIDH